MAFPYSNMLTRLLLLLSLFCLGAASACSNGNSGTGRVLTTVTVTPSAASVLNTTGTQQFTVVALDQSNVPFLPVVDVAIVWAVTNPAGGSIDQLGLFTAGTVGIYPGLVTATVTHNGTTEIVADTSDVTVTP